MITGKLLGDANLTIQNGRKSRLRFSHKIEDFSWCDYCYRSLCSYLPLNPPIYRKVKDPRIKAGFTEHFYVQSKTSPLIELLKPYWYNGNKKVIPNTIIELAMNPQCLAWWYQDDGHLLKKEDKLKKVILSTDYFTHEENLYLINTLKSKFQLMFKLDQQNRLILYDQPQVMYFLSLVAPYVILDRKKPPVNSTYQIISSKRTTVYLPKNLISTKPTGTIIEAMKSLPCLIQLTQSNEGLKTLFFTMKEMNPSEEYSAYQITIPLDSLLLINQLQQKTGFRNSKIIELCFLFKNGHLQRDDHQ